MKLSLSTVILCIMLLVPLAAFSKIGGGDVEYKPKGAANVLFQHEYHVQLKGMKCNNCHYKPFAMSGSNVYKMDMKALTKGQFCGFCHNGKGAFDLSTASNCKRCHKD